MGLKSDRPLPKISAFAPFICVNLRLSIVICGYQILFFLPQMMADKHRLTQMIYINFGGYIGDCWMLTGFYDSDATGIDITRIWNYQG